MKVDPKQKRSRIERIAFEKGYRVSDCGTIVTGPRGKTLSLRTTSGGSTRFCLYADGRRRDCMTSRLLAFQKFGSACDGDFGIWWADGNAKNRTLQNIILVSKSQAFRAANAQSLESILARRSKKYPQSAAAERLRARRKKNYYNNITARRKRARTWAKNKYHSDPVFRRNRLDNQAKDYAAEKATTRFFAMHAAGALLAEQMNSPIQSNENSNN